MIRYPFGTYRGWGEKDDKWVYGGYYIEDNVGYITPTNK